MIKTRLQTLLAAALKAAAPSLNALDVTDELLAGLRIERPRNPEHGDYAVNVSFLARQTKMAPPKIAEAILAALPENPDFTVQGMGGYLNFATTQTLQLEALQTIVTHDNPGKNESLAAEVILLEYVSANPTGPLHVGHGRWAALGDSLMRMFSHCGATATAEFYINDFGFQMEKLALSVWWRSLELLANPETSYPQITPPIREALPAFAGLLAGRELPYPGEFVVDVATAYLRHDGQIEAVLADYEALKTLSADGDVAAANITDLSAWQTAIKGRIIGLVAPEILAGQQALLKELRVHFDIWTSETQALHATGDVEKALETLKTQGFSYELDGALWFKSSAFGDEKDRVLKKSDGSYTYLAADIAYHHQKFLRTAPNGARYNRILNIWGADHHGYIARMRGAIVALGHNGDQFEVLLGQLVNLIVDGERTRMGKRRKMLTLQDVMEEVGVDATRYWMVSKSSDSTLDFDIDLASSATSDNPVFYVQYAYARCCSIFRNATDPGLFTESSELNPAYLKPDALKAYEHDLTAEALLPLLSALPTDADRAVVKNLICLLDNFEEMVKDATRLRAPHFLTQYMSDVSASYHSFYNVCRILTPQPEVTLARLMLIRAIQKTLHAGLQLIGVEAPEKM